MSIINAVFAALTNPYYGLSLWFFYPEKYGRADNQAPAFTGTFAAGMLPKPISNGDCFKVCKSGVHYGHREGMFGNAGGSVAVGDAGMNSDVCKSAMPKEKPTQGAWAADMPGAAVMLSNYMFPKWAITLGDALTQSNVVSEYTSEKVVDIPCMIYMVFSMPGVPGLPSWIMQNEEVQATPPKFPSTFTCKSKIGPDSVHMAPFSVHGTSMTMHGCLVMMISAFFVFFRMGDDHCAPCSKKLDKLDSMEQVKNPQSDVKVPGNEQGSL